MKLVQNMNTRRHYGGVEFPKGVPVELPADFPEQKVRALLAWGWEKVEEAEPVNATTPEPIEEAEVEHDEPEATSDQDDSVVAPAPRGRGRRR